MLQALWKKCDPALCRFPPWVVRAGGSPGATARPAGGAGAVCGRGAGPPTPGGLPPPPATVGHGGQLLAFPLALPVLLLPVAHPRNAADVGPLLLVRRCWSAAAGGGLLLLLHPHPSTPPTTPPPLDPPPPPPQHTHTHTHGHTHTPVAAAGPVPDDLDPGQVYAAPPRCPVLPAGPHGRGPAGGPLPQCPASHPLGQRWAWGVGGREVLPPVDWVRGGPG